MQVTSINSINATNNNPAFGAKLKLGQYEDYYIFSKAGKQLAHFSEPELRQVEKLFEDRTKDIKGTLKLCLGDVMSNIRGTYLCYQDSEGKQLFSSSVALKLHRPESEEKVPKSVPEFVDKMVGALKVMQNRHIQTQNIEKLEQEIETLKTNRTNSTISELGKYFELQNPDKV